MKVTRDVVLDLMPLYLAGEASPDTRALVEDSLREDPALAARVRAGDRALIPDRPLAPAPTTELASLLRTRRTLGRLRWTCALATTLTAISLAVRVEFRDGRLTTFRFLVADEQLLFGTCLLAAATLWWLYFRMRRRARGTGLA
jgi:hypothetical protein